MSSVKIGFEGQAGAHSETAAIEIIQTQPSFKNLQAQTVGFKSFEDVNNIFICI